MYPGFCSIQELAPPGQDASLSHGRLANIASQHKFQVYLSVNDFLLLIKFIMHNFCSLFFQREIMRKKHEMKRAQPGESDKEALKWS